MSLPRTSAIATILELLTLVQNEIIKIPKEYRDQVLKTKLALQSDVSGLINTTLDFSINCATVNYSIQTDNSNLTEVLNNWLQKINVGVRNKNGTKSIPTGIQALSKEYFRERWKGSSNLLLRTFWTKENGLDLPTTLFFVDGEDIKAQIPKNGVVALGQEKYALRINNNEEDDIKLPQKENELIFIQRPFESWGVYEPTPYLIRKGLYRNLQFFSLMSEKGEMIFGKALEYLLQIKKGTEAMTLSGSADLRYGEQDLKKVKEDFKSIMEKRKREKGTPTYATQHDTEIEHLIPEYQRAVNAAIYEPIERRILAGLGLVEIVSSAGASISKDEFVLVKVDNNISYINIAKLEEQFNNFKVEGHSLEVPTYKDGKLEWKNATIFKHPFKGFIYRITTDNGRFNVEVTGNHSVMGWNEDGLTLKRADQLIKGDYLLSPLNFNIGEHNYQKLIYNYSINQSLHKKEILKFDEDLAYLFGWYVAEGYGGSTRSNPGVTLTMNKDEVKYANILLKIAKRKFSLRGGKISYRDDKGKVLFIKGRKLVSNGCTMDLSFGGQCVGKIFVELCGHLSPNKKVPQIVFNSPRNVQLKFLEGLFLGDGDLDDRYGEGWKLSTVSKELAFGTVCLLQQLGYHPYISKFRREGYELPEYKVGYNKKEHDERVQTRILGIPTKFIPEFLPNREACNKKLYKNEWYEKYKFNFPSDWLFKEVIKIEKFPYEGDVYDLEVKDNETFVAGCGNILVHNTRRESVLSPRPFIAEVECGIQDFAALLTDIMYMIIERNVSNHQKWMNSKIRIHNDPIQDFIDRDAQNMLRSAYDRGKLSARTFVEVCLGLDFDREIQRRLEEKKKGYDKTLYPQVLVNQEKESYIPDFQDNVPDDRKGIEKKNFKQASTWEAASQYIGFSLKCLKCEYEGDVSEFLDTLVHSEKFGKTVSICPGCKEELQEEDVDFLHLSRDFEQAPYTNTNYPKQLQSLPVAARNLWIKSYNAILKETKDEDQARQGAWRNVSLKYKKVGDKWQRKTQGEFLESAKELEFGELVELKKLEILGKQNKILDTLLKENSDANI